MTEVAKHIINRIALRTGAFAAIALAGLTLAGCANLQGQPDGPGNCVGPPGLCVPYFGANAIVPATQPPRAYAALHRSSQASRQSAVA
jgi:hypothetical protein